MSPSRTAAIEADLQEWLCQELAARLEIPGGRIDPAEPMSAYGLDSLRAVAVLTEVEEHVGFEIDSDVLWDHPTVADLARYLAARMDRPEP
ncbi:acyl carrier protein [Actinoplanes sp. NPDC026619]|uniref:acyl carrier protein n=1 Tax=Actinoplanes sp. NPDC026619 TaxID=3155798 RepID=UPI0033DDFB72